VRSRDSHDWIRPSYRTNRAVRTCWVAV